MRKRNRKKQFGFTLVEALVASVILGGAVMTLAAFSTRCLSRTRFNQEYELAWQVLDQQLTMIDVMGIDEFVNEGLTQGEIQGSEDDEEPKYRWQADITSEPEDNLYMVSITLWWRLDNKWHSIAASTMFNGQGTSTLAPETQENQQNENPNKNT